MQFEEACARLQHVGYHVRHVGCFRGQWSAVIGSEKVFSVTGYGASAGEALADALANTPEMKPLAPQPSATDIFG